MHQDGNNGPVFSSQRSFELSGGITPFNLSSTARRPRLDPPKCSRQIVLPIPRRGQPAICSSLWLTRTRGPARPIRDNRLVRRQTDPLIPAGFAATAASAILALSDVRTILGRSRDPAQDP